MFGEGMTFHCKFNNGLEHIGKMTHWVLSANEGTWPSASETAPYFPVTPFASPELWATWKRLREGKQWGLSLHTPFTSLLRGKDSSWAMADIQPHCRANSLSEALLLSAQEMLDFARALEKGTASPGLWEGLRLLLRTPNLGHWRKL